MAKPGGLPPGRPAAKPGTLRGAWGDQQVPPHSFAISLDVKPKGRDSITPTLGFWVLF